MIYFYSDNNKIYMLLWVYFLQFLKNLDIPLILPDNTESITLEDLLKDNFKKESITFDTIYESCNKRTVHIKENLISRPPQILLI